MKAKKKKPLQNIYALYDAKGELFEMYASKQEAQDNIWGPRFRPEYSIRQYRLVLKKDETDE